MTNQIHSPGEIVQKIGQLASDSNPESLNIKGTELEVSFDQTAKLKSKDLWQLDPRSKEQPKPQVRVYLEGKGCDGFYYGVTFDQQKPDDFFSPHEELDVLVDPQTLQFIYGANVTWTASEVGEGFLVSNPHHERIRGKFFKKKAWMTALTSQPSE